MSATGLPTWIEWCLIVLLALFSGLFSGLNLGLMGLDPVGLEIVLSGGEPNRSYAQKIKPLRDHGNWLLCTLLLGNVAVNAALSILLSEHTGGVVGFLLSTAIIVVFGEIVPQAFCSRYALLVGARTVYIVWPLMWLLAIIAYPIAWLLDRILGDELGTIYSNKELQKLVDIHAQLEETGLNQRTANMLKGALGLQEKQVKDVMTVVTEVFWLNADAKLTFDVLVEIFKSGHSRIPIISIDKFNRTTVEGILYVKDLILLDPDDEMPVSQIMSAFRHKRPPTVWSDSTLDTALRTFLKENQHLAIVQSITDRADHMSALNLKQPSNPALVAPRPEAIQAMNNMNTFGNMVNMGSMGSIGNFGSPAQESTGHVGADRIYEFIGIITLEDVIEHVLQTQLVDEHDNFIDTHHNQKTGRLDNFEWALLHMFDHRHRVLTNLPPQELQAVYHFLCQSVRTFAPGTARMSEASIKNLLASSAVIRVNLSMHQTQNKAINSGYANSNFANTNRLGVPEESGPNLGVSGKLHSSSSLNANTGGDGSQWDGHGGAARRLGYSSGAVAKGHVTQRDPYKDIENNGLLLYQRDVKTDYFSLLLDGKCEVIAGKQGFRCELSRWSYLCPDALEHVEECVLNNKPTLDYVADFTCKVIENSRVLRIKLSDFRACLEGKFEPPNKVVGDIWGERPNSTPILHKTNDVNELHRLLPKTILDQTEVASNNNSGGLSNQSHQSPDQPQGQGSPFLMSNQRNPSSSSLSGLTRHNQSTASTRTYAQNMALRGGLPRTDTNVSNVSATDGGGSGVGPSSGAMVGVSVATTGPGGLSENKNDVEIPVTPNSTSYPNKHIYKNSKKPRGTRLQAAPGSQAHSTIHEESVLSRDSPFADVEDGQPAPYVAASQSQTNLVTDSNNLLGDLNNTNPWVNQTDS